MLNLRRAAQRKSQHAETRVDAAIRELVRRGEPINFRSVQRESGPSISYLYGPKMRHRIQQLRDQQHDTPTRPALAPPDPGTSSVVRTLSHQLTELKARHQRETRELREALAAAHAELLALRRQLGTRDNSWPDADQSVPASIGGSAPVRLGEAPRRAV